MKEKETNQRDGQTLVQVAAMMVLLLIVLALAIDVGNIYQHRRQMQNAADAGALAGAREICLGHTQAEAEQKAIEVAGLNSAQDVEVTFMKEGWWVHVVASEESDMFFAGIIGMPTLDVGAGATSACGTVTAACGFMPVGWPEDQWLEISAECGNEFYLIDSNDCGEEPDDLMADQDDDGFRDVACTGLGSELNSWLVLPPPDVELYPTGCGCTNNASDLTCVVNGGYAGVLPLPSCVNSEPGWKESVAATIRDRIGDTVIWPLFDRECGEPDDPPIISCSDNKVILHLTSVGCGKIVSEQKLFDLLQNDGTVRKNVLGVQLAVSCDEEACYNDCGSTAGDAPPDPGDVWAVNLVE